MSDADSASLYDPSEEDHEDVDWKSTPSSRIPRQQGVSEQAKINVRAVDPNEGRCLVENCVETRAVDFAHCFPRRMSFKRIMMDNIEWHWNMRRNTLNLDTRRNIFRAGAAIHRLFDNHSWLLIPEEAIVQIYHNTLTFDKGKWITNRALFPDIPDRDKPEYFEYKLVPTLQMDEIALHRQADPSGRRPTSNDFATYVYPFSNLPLLRSHIHPKYVILEMGRKLKVSYPTLNSLVESYPILTRILNIYTAWVTKLPSHAFQDKSFKSKKNSGNDNDQDDHLEDGRTAPRRLRDRKRPRTQNDPDDSPTPAPGQAGQRHHTLKRQPSVSLSKKSLKLHDEKFEGKQWTTDAVRDWSKQCRPLPEMVHSPWEPSQICI